MGLLVIIMVSSFLLINAQRPPYDRNGLVDPDRRDHDAVIVPEETVDPEKQRKEFIRQMKKNKKEIEARNKEFARRKYNLGLWKIKFKPRKKEEGEEKPSISPSHQKPIQRH